MTGLQCSFPILSSLLLNDILCVKVYLNVAMLCMCLGKGNVGEVVVSFNLRSGKVLVTLSAKD